MRLFLTTMLSGAMGSFDGVGWFLINAPAPEFGGELGMPMDVSWESGELKIDLTIAVSEYYLQT